MPLTQKQLAKRREDLRYLYFRRKQIFDAVKKLFGELVNDRTYHIIRGAVNWTTWDFKAYPFAVSILTRQNTFRGQNRPRDGGFNKMRLVLEVFTGTAEPAPDNALETARLLDGVLDEIWIDTVMVIESLACEVDDRENPLVMKYDTDEDATEVHDSSATVQGVVFEITLDY